MPNKVAVIMGSKSDWKTMEQATLIMDELNVSYHVEIVSAHRTPDKLMDFAKQAKDKGYQIIIAGAGGAAHLPGMVASQTPLPVLGVPIKSQALSGLDSLLSIVQMPKGVSVGTLAIGDAGAYNAGLLACQILALHDSTLAQNLTQFRNKQTHTILNNADPRKDE